MRTCYLIHTLNLITHQDGSAVTALTIISSIIIGLVIGFFTLYIAEILTNSRQLEKQECPEHNQVFRIKEYFSSFKCPGCSKNTLTRLIIIISISIPATILLRMFPYANLGFWASLPVLIFLGVILVIDVEHRLVLIETSLFGMILFSIYGIAMWGVLRTFTGAAAGLLFMLLLYFSGIVFSKIIGKLRHKEIGEVVFGFGDVMVGTFLGLFAGWPLILTGIFYAMVLFCAFAFLYIIALVITKRYHAFTTAVPFTPFLILGVVAAFYLV